MGPVARCRPSWVLAVIALVGGYLSFVASSAVAGASAALDDRAFAAALSRAYAPSSGTRYPRGPGGPVVRGPTAPVPAAGSARPATAEFAGAWASAAEAATNDR